MYWFLFIKTTHVNPGTPSNCGIFIQHSIPTYMHELAIHVYAYLNW